MSTWLIFSSSFVEPLEIMVKGFPLLVFASAKIFKYKTEYNLRNNHKTNFVIQNKSFERKSFERAW